MSSPMIIDSTSPTTSNDDQTSQRPLSSTTMSNSCFKRVFSLDSIKNLEIFKQNAKLLIKLKICVEQMNFYEAHQAYKTMHFRCMNHNYIEDSLELIFNGICFFLENSQTQCGFDLSKTFIETLKKSSIKTLDSLLLDKISYIHQLLRNCSEERNEFVVNILKWSATTNISNLSQKATSFGNPDVHREFAVTLWKEKNFKQSRYHFLRSYDGESFAHMLVEYNLECGYPSEIDLFIAQSVLQYLCLKNKLAASSVFEYYTKIHPNIFNGPPYLMPLLNFLWLLLLSLEGAKQKVFINLCDTYKPSINRDPCYKEYLEKIGQIYFKLKSKNTSNMNPLNNILRMFMGPESTPQNTNNNEIVDEVEEEEELDDDSYVDLDDNETLD